MLHKHTEHRDHAFHVERGRFIRCRESGWYFYNGMYVSIRKHVLAIMTFVRRFKITCIAYEISSLICFRGTRHVEFVRLGLLMTLQIKFQRRRITALTCMHTYYTYTSNRLFKSLCPQSTHPVPKVLESSLDKKCPDPVWAIPIVKIPQ